MTGESNNGLSALDKLLDRGRAPAPSSVGDETQADEAPIPQIEEATQETPSCQADTVEKVPVIEGGTLNAPPSALAALLGEPEQYEAVEPGIFADSPDEESEDAKSLSDEEAPVTENDHSAKGELLAGRTELAEPDEAAQNHPQLEEEPPLEEPVTNESAERSPDANPIETSEIVAEEVEEDDAYEDGVYEGAKKEPGGYTKGMLHRAAKDDCPVCKIWGIKWSDIDPDTWGKQHIYSERLWEIWGGGTRSRWPEKAVAAGKEMGFTFTEAEVKKHFKYHRPEQPMLSGSLRREKLLAQGRELSERYKALIRMVYRQRILTTEQIIEVLYIDGRTENSAGVLARRELLNMASKHFLYRYCTPALGGNASRRKSTKKKKPPAKFGNMTLYLLGRAAIPLIEDLEGVKVYPEHYTKRSRDVASETLLHDIKSNGIFVQLHRALRERSNLIEIVRGVDQIVELLPENWYGPKQLNMQFTDPLTQKMAELRADGFASLSIHRAEWDPESRALPSCQLPFFYEFDHGTKIVPDVAQQLLAYHKLSLSRAANKRFPDTDVEGYAIPVIMTFSGEKRMQNIQNRFIEMLEDEKVVGTISPIFLVLEDEWYADPLAARVFVAWDKKKTPYKFLDLLVQSARPLTSAGITLATVPLILDKKAAKRATTRMDSSTYAEKANSITQRQIEKMGDQNSVQGLASISDREHDNDENI